MREKAQIEKILNERKSPDSLSSEEVKDVEISRKEIADGKSKVFENAKDLIADLHQTQKTRIRKKIEDLFREAKVVTLEQIEPVMENDPEKFWGESGKRGGMLEFLARKGFDILPCHKEGEQLQSEIYVAFDRFESEFPESEPTIFLSEPASQNPDIEIIKEWTLNLAKTIHKGRIEIAQYGKDGFKVFFSQTPSLSDKEKRRIILQKLSRELHVKFEGEEEGKRDES
jgi:hypothetical protein